MTLPMVFFSFFGASAVSALRGFAGASSWNARMAPMFRSLELAVVVRGGPGSASATDAFTLLDAVTSSTTATHTICTLRPRLLTWAMTCSDREFHDRQVRRWSLVISSLGQQIGRPVLPDLSA